MIIILFDLTLNSMFDTNVVLISSYQLVSMVLQEDFSYICVQYFLIKAII